MFTIKEEAGQLVATFPSRLDTAACTAWQTELLTQVEAHPLPVVFDLANVTFVSSLFLRLCLATYKKRGAGQFRLVSLSPEVKKVFKVAGLDLLLAPGN